MKNTSLPKYIWLAFLFLLVCGQLAKWQVTQNIALYFYDILIAFYLVWQAISAILEKKKIPKFWQTIPISAKKIGIILISLVALGWLWQLFQGNWQLSAFLYLFRLFAYLLFVINIQKQVKQTRQSLLWALAIMLVLAFLQYFFLPDLRFLKYSGYDDHFFRLVGTMLDPGFMGLLIIFLLIPLFHYFEKGGSYLWLMPGIIALLLTYSRASYLTFFLVALLNLIHLVIQKKKNLALWFFLLSFLFSLPFLPKDSGGEGVQLTRTSSITARLLNDQNILQEMSPVEWGIGGGLFYSLPKESNYAIHAHFADNIFVFLLSNFGLPASLLLLFLLGQECYRQFRNKDYERLSYLLAIFSHSFFNNNLSQSQIILSFLLLYQISNRNKLEALSPIPGKGK
jgi:hypothetical protein